MHALGVLGIFLVLAFNAATNLFLNNCLNQTTHCWTPVDMGETEDQEPPQDADVFTWAASGGLQRDGRWVYVFDAEDRLVSVTSALQTNGAVRVLNRYDHRHRRISKTLQRYVVATNTASALQPSNASAGWETRERRDFVYDDWNLIHETMTTVDANAITNVSEVQYFWGPDLSGTLQGAGGVGGLLAVSMEGGFYFPVYDNNGNIVKYVDETGSVVASYEYDDFGGALSSGGPMAEDFRFRFSTKYYEHEVDLYYYGYRFYSPTIKKWVSSDPIEEAGGDSLYGFIHNEALLKYDLWGLKAYLLFHSPDEKRNNQPPVPFGRAARRYAGTIKKRRDYDPQCDTVVVKEVSCFEDVQRVLREQKDIVEIVFFSHGGESIDGKGVLYLSQKDDKEANVADSNTGSVRVDIGSGTLFDFNCRSIADWDSSNMSKTGKRVVKVYACHSLNTARALGKHFNASAAGISGTCYYPVRSKGPVPCGALGYGIHQLASTVWDWWCDLVTIL